MRIQHNIMAMNAYRNYNTNTSVLSLILGPLMGAVGSVFWFFTYRFTILPVAAVLPVFLALGVLVPLWTYRSVARRTLVERLREAES